MAPRHDMAGYLVLKPAGALSRLKARKRLWYVLDEGGCQLLYYKCENDANHGKEPIGSINVRGAAISLTLEEANEFVIHSEGKDHVLVAENHESMMLWILALQKESLLSEPVNSQKSPVAKTKILRAHSLQLDRKSSEDKEHNPLTRMRSLLTAHSNEQSDFCIEEHRDRVAAYRSQLSTVSQSADNEEESVETVCPKQVLSNSTSNSSNSSSSNNSNATQSPTETMGATTDSNGLSATNAKKPRSPLCDAGSTERSSETESCDDSEGSNGSSPTEDTLSTVGAHQDEVSSTFERVRLLRKMNSEGLSPEEMEPLKDRAQSLSGVSTLSGDSVIRVCENLQSSRLRDLETELVSSKCDLAKALNRESSYKSMIEEKSILITELEEKLKLFKDCSDGKGSSPPPPKSSSAIKRMQEKCRILQNHNRFLNEEVLKLSKILQQEQNIGRSKQSQIRSMESENDQLKRDYAFLFQSSLRISNSDGPETMEVYLYGGERHRERVLSLLEEGKKINPTLPSYENLSRNLCHVDPLGFRQSCTEEGLILHYICRQLYQHYNTLAPGYEVHQQNWKKQLKLYPTLPRTKELKALVRLGVPSNLRSRVWALLYKTRVKDVMDDKGSHYYSYLCSMAPDDERVSQHKRQIALDLLRTMPDNIRFSDLNADGVRKMQEVLQAFCLHNPTLGYCQGMNFLVGMCLLFLEPEDAFWCLVAITERYFTPNYFDQNLIGAQADQEVLKDLLREKMPALWSHLATLDIELCTVTLNWFLAVFFDCVPFETLLRIWDCFLLEGPKVLFRFSLAILKLNEKFILTKHDTVSIMRQLKAAARLSFDVDSLFKTAFEGLRSFTRRRDIAAKQACYYKALKEHAKKNEIEKVALKEKETMLSEMEVSTFNQLVIECAAAYDNDKLWLCHGHQHGAQISKVNCEENIMYRLNIELESRVMSMHSLDDDTMMLGTLSHFVHAYSTRARRLIWESRLNDSVLALSCYEEDGRKQVYAGLADGTIGVIENMEGHASKPEIFYIMIGSSPVTCLRLVDRRLWCGSGNRVIILNARTLDTIDQFLTSSSVLDYVSMLVPDEQGVWVTLRGSSVLQLWDTQNLTCKLLFDVKDNRYPRSPKQQDEETTINQARITAVLPFSGSVLVGTAEGSLIVYDLVTRISRSPSSSDFASSRRSVQAESAPTVDRIQERIQELLMEQRRRDEPLDSTSTVRARSDSGCYSNPVLQANANRRESQHVLTDSLPTQLENEVEEEDNSAEDRSEATSISTIRQVGTDPTVMSPDSQLSQLCDDAEERPVSDVTQNLPPVEPFKDIKAQIKHVDDLMFPKRGDTDRDSGRSSSSTQGKLGDEVDDLTTEVKRLCTCHQLSTTNIKCRHCLLETSEALRQLFNKYSLSTNLTNHVDSNTTKYNAMLDTGSSLVNSYNYSSFKEEQNETDSRANIESELCVSEKGRQEDGLSESSCDSCHHKDNNGKVAGTTEDSEHRNNEELTAKHLRTSRRRMFGDNGFDRVSSRKSLFRAISADDVTRWVKSQENLSSSLTSDYDYDDVFVAYTEDESLTNERVPSYLRRGKPEGEFRSHHTEALLESLKLRTLSRRRSSNIYDYAGSSYSMEQWLSTWCKSRSSSPWIDSASSSSLGKCHLNNLTTRPRLLDVRSQLPIWDRGVLASESETGSHKRHNSVSNDATSPNNWLSYEESVTDNELGKGNDLAVNKDLLYLGDWSNANQKGSDTASNVSFSSTEVPYTYEMCLQERIKISDKPIKCLLETKCGGEPTIISCAGCYGDDEAVLKWTKLGDGKLWTNDPIIEVCPYTNAIKPSPYARSRLPRRTTSLALMTVDNETSQKTGWVSATTPSSVMGSGLAKVQNIFQRVHDRV